MSQQTKPANTALQQGSVKVPLAFALNTPGGPVTALTFRRGKARDMLMAQRVESDAARRELVLMSMLCDPPVAPEDLEELDLADLAEVQAAFQGLFMRPAASSGAVGGASAAGQVVRVPAL